ncbi:MAG: hypothetical protein HW387_428 [Parachlamydiales bacterium]|nr:hypothetical protein [Parachlamydiales bacterium]
MKAIPYSNLITLMFTIIMDIMGVGLVLPLLPNLVVSTTSPFYNGVDSFISYGIVLAVWSLGGFFGSPFLGSFSDRIGRKKILITSLSCNAIIYAFTALAVLQKWFIFFILMRFCSGFFSGSFEIAQAAVADKSSHEDKAKNMSYMILAVALGSIVGPFLSGVTVSFGVIMPFIFAACLSCLNVFCLSVFFRETHERKAHKILWLSLMTSFTFLFRDPRTRRLAIVFLAFQFAWGFYFQSISLVLHEAYHFIPKQISFFFIVLGIGFALVPLFFQKFMMQFFSLRMTSFWGFIISGIFISLSFFLRSIEEIQWVVVFVFSVFECLAFSSLLAMLSNQVTSEEQGKLMGGCGSLFAISFIVIGLSVGVLSNLSIWFSTLLSAAFFFLSGILIHLIKEKDTFSDRSKN